MATLLALFIAALQVIECFLFMPMLIAIRMYEKHTWNVVQVTEQLIKDAKHVIVEDFMGWYR